MLRLWLKVGVTKYAHQAIRRGEADEIWAYSSSGYSDLIIYGWKKKLIDWGFLVRIWQRWNRYIIMDDQAGIDCSGLVTRTNFPQYLTALISVTGRDLSNVTQCKATVCNALWGSGNPDISGIGVCI